MDVAGDQAWIVVADSPFLPAAGGGQVEHLGFVEAAKAAGLLAALVVPHRRPVGHDDHLSLKRLRDLVAPAPLIGVPRSSGIGAAVHPTMPYVVRSRAPTGDLVRSLREQVDHATGVVIYSYKSHRIGQAVAEGLHLPALLRQHNLEGEYHRALAASAPAPRRWVMRWEAARIDADERRLEKSSWLRGIADISAADAKIRSSRATVTVRHVPSFALAFRSAATALPRIPPPQPTVVFVGALDVATNHDAIRWFAAEVWPQVLALVPRARWQIVGRRPTRLVEDLVRATPATELHPDVESPSVYLASASAAVNPAVSGSGVNIKVLDYLGAGAPVVSTSRTAEALGLRPDVDLLVSDDPRVFATELARLLQDSAAATELGRQGQRTALSTFDSHASLVKMAQFFEEG